MEQGVDIINLSLGFPRESSYDLTRALEEATIEVSPFSPLPLITAIETQ